MSKVLVFRIIIRPLEESGVFGGEKRESFRVTVRRGLDGEPRNTAGFATYAAAVDYADGVFAGLRVAHGDCSIAYDDLTLVSRAV